jgi:hypothetical protein
VRHGFINTTDLFVLFPIVGHFATHYLCGGVGTCSYLSLRFPPAWRRLTFIRVVFSSRSFEFCATKFRYVLTVHVNSAANKTKSIAVSNFSPDQLDCIVANKTAGDLVLQLFFLSLGFGGHLWFGGHLTTLLHLLWHVSQVTPCQVI